MKKNPDISALLEEVKLLRREQEVEAALERLRAQSMAMHKSDELIQVVRILDKAISGLGIEAWGTQIITDFANPENGSNVWLAVEGQDYLEKFHVPFIKHPIFKKLFTAVQKGTDFYSETYSKVDKDEYFKLIFKFSDFKSIPIERQNFAYSSPGMTRVQVLSKNSILIFQRFDLKEFSKEEEGIFKRFGKVFEQAYTRFLDLQKAEAQAREAKIETALERVRSRSMAMHNSNELRDVVNTLHNELRSLNVNFHVAIIQLLMGDPKDLYLWAGTSDGLYDDLVYWPYVDIRVRNEIYQAQLSKTPIEIVLTQSETKEFFEEYFNVKGTPQGRKAATASVELIDFMGFYQANTGIFLMRYSEGSYSEDEKIITERFSKVFEQTYTRFLDLQKAEVQAREAEIQLALERVRAITMAMQKQDDLLGVLDLLVEQLTKLGVQLDEANFSDGVPVGDWNLWALTPFGDGATLTDYVHFPKINHPYFLSVEEYLENYKIYGTDLSKAAFTKEQKDSFLDYCFSQTKYRDTLSLEVMQYLYDKPGYAWSSILLKETWVTIGRYDGIPFSDEEDALLRRFANSFGQAYTRFLDLQKAEAQAREAIKQASLDRVRGEIASMRDAKDLERITPLVWKELQSLGVPFFRCGVMLVNEEQEVIDFYLSNPQGEALAALRLDFDSSELTQKGVSNWRNEKTYIEHWNQEQFLTFMRSLMDQGQISNAATYQGGEKPPTALTLQFVPFAQGMLYVGSEIDLNAEELDLVKALGKSLSVAYARYEDFVKLEQAKAEVESAMSELKATQSQLIQQEKLASLGQLTAGIAHEIKNPLNFVNNFSDLSRELIEEVFEELKNLESSETKQEIIAILQDVQSNLTKVHEHGSRADSIVTSMLQHSRASGSKREPKPFNPLVKEFVNLSFHGMRAGKAPINVDIDLQLDDQIGDVTLISEDFSRVILNLCNNAFDAMRDKLKLEVGSGKSEAYLPKLTVTTALQKDQVILSISDNGGGIPEEIRDKILQPFFTTKKGTDGTGLGLSITHDIVKAHGGELDIQSQPGNTIFKIHLTL
jgi:signal transduction histidine kinase